MMNLAFLKSEYHSYQMENGIMVLNKITITSNIWAGRRSNKAATGDNSVDEETSQILVADHSFIANYLPNGASPSYQDV
jgi:hypothetical protein